MRERKSKKDIEKKTRTSDKKTSPCHFHFGETPSAVKNFLELVKKHKRRGAVLDLGCDDGMNAIFFARHGYEGHGIDSHAETIKRAKACASKTGVSESTHFRIGDVFNLPYPERFFDVVIDFGCFHHIPKTKWTDYLQSILRVMKPDALLMLTVYTLRDKHVPNRTRQYVTHQGHYDYFFSKKDIKEIFEKHFDILSLTEENLITPTQLKHSFYHVYMRRKQPKEEF